MYLRIVFRSTPVCLAIADTDSPCRCISKIMTISPSLITAIPLSTIESSIGDDAPPVLRGAPRRTGGNAKTGEDSNGTYGEY